MFAPYAVYTILHRDKLTKYADSGKTTSLLVKRRWVTGFKIFDEAQRKGQLMAILYADANKCSRLLFWGTLTRIEVDADGTRFAVADFVPISGKKTQELILKSTSNNIAKMFIKPYAIVETPAYIARSANSSQRQ